ncbi:MAG: C-terminal binding protein [Bacillota bacterium]
MKTVVITDYSYPDVELERAIIEGAGFRLVDYRDRITEDDVIPVTSMADAVIVQRAKISERVIGAMSQCQVIVRYGVGVDNVDVRAATRRGILVCNVPDYGTTDVADHTMTLLLACHRGIVELTKAVKAQVWNYRIVEPLHRLSACCLGIIGCGRIGREVALRARVFGMEVIGYDPYVDRKSVEAAGIRLTSLQELLEKADFVTIHTPLTEETRGMIGQRELRRMKPGAILVNTARGGIVDEEALYFALRDRRLRAAALDVFAIEPLGRSLLTTLDNVILTPHCAWYSEEAMLDLKKKVAEEVVRVLKGNRPLNPVNPDVLGKE